MFVCAGGFTVGLVRQYQVLCEADLLAGTALPVARGAAGEEERLIQCFAICSVFLIISGLYFYFNLIGRI